MGTTMVCMVIDPSGGGGRGGELVSERLGPNLLAFSPTSGDDTSFICKGDGKY